jgi:hypothetical protein
MKIQAAFACWRTARAAGGCLVFVGCAGVTDVVETGPGTYMVASHGTMGWSSGPAQKAKAYQKATDFCRTKGLQLHAVADHEEPGGFGKIASGEVHFACVSAPSASEPRQ